MVRRRVPIPAGSPLATNNSTMTSASSTRHSEHDDGRSEAGDNNSFIHVNSISNADLYSTPPAYAPSAADDEVSVNAEAVQAEKHLHTPTPSTAPSTAGDTAIDRDNEEPAPALPQRPGSSTPSRSIEELPPVYFEHYTEDASRVSIRRCSILPNRPAIWLVKNRELALSPLAATVLVKKDIIKSKDLELISQTAGVKRDPNDPFSGIMFATYDTVGDIMSGLVAGPVEAAKQVQPMLVKRESTRMREELQPPSSSSGNQESSPLLSESEQQPRKSNMEGGIPQQSGEMTSETKPRPNTSQQSDRPSVTPEEAQSAAKEIALSAGKGFGKIIGTGLKAPMTFTHGITRGFHNLPKMYGEEVREYENVTDFKSGLSVSAKSFGLGVYDGIKDFMVQPVIGAQKEGGRGFVKGFGKGLGNIICKPAAGAVGLVGYSSVGVYKSLQSLKPSEKNEILEQLKTQGDMEYAQAADQTRNEVIRRWYQLTGKQN